MNLNDAKVELVKNVSEVFPGHHVDFSFDSDDEGIVYVRVYGIPDDNVNDSKRLVWDVIDALEAVDGVEFVPSIISMTNTRLYHAKFLLPVIDDFDIPVSDGIMQLLEQSVDLYSAQPIRSHPCIVHGWNNADDLAVLHDINEVTDERSFRFAA